MSGAVRIICRPGSAPGFGLAGLRADPVSDPAGLDQVLTAVQGHPECRVLLIDEDLYEVLPQDVRTRLERAARPVVVPFPGPGWGGRAEAEERVVELLRRAIGYRVRLA